MLGHAVIPQHMVGRCGVVVCLVGLNARHAMTPRRVLQSMVGGVVVLWCGLVGLNAGPCCDTSAHGWTLWCCGVFSRVKC